MLAVFMLVIVSLPSLGAWIETCFALGIIIGSASRSLHWERGLKRTTDRYRDSHVHVAPFIGSVD